jgi:uncharacterized protein YbaR (Trm112 family)
MKISTLNKLCCPFDKSDLDLTTITADTENRILEGWLHCGQCQRIYPIVKGLPIMNPDEYREIALEKPLLEKWSKYLEGKTVRNFRLIPEITDSKS